MLLQMHRPFVTHHTVHGGNTVSELNVIQFAQSTEDCPLDPISRWMLSLSSVKILALSCKLLFSFQKIRTVIHVQSFTVAVMLF